MMHMQLDDIILIGHTFDEYRRIFALDDSYAALSILDAGSGVSSFCAEANALGWNVTASDTIYQFDGREIAEKCRADFEFTMAQMPDIAEGFVWDTFGGIDGHRHQRECAYKRFLRDFAVKGQSRYVPNTLPRTNFRAAQFDIAIVSHLLFLYEDHLTYTFHKLTIQELLRVTSDEVRIFPITNLKGERSRYLEQVMTDSAFNIYDFEIVSVEYEFLRGANEMLVIRHGNI